LATAEIPAPEVLVAQFEAAIKSLVRRFRTHPYAFYTETDMHCYLSHRLYAGGLVNGLYRTLDGHDSVLLHKEYPTVARYQRRDDGRLEENAQGRRRRAFDLSVWDPHYIAQHEHRKQKVLCAAELALDECRPGNPHTVNDATKLYLLFFVRDSRDYERNQAEVWKNLEEAASRARVEFVHVDGTRKPKPVYLGAWGVT
jgi:hypothetical protein